MENTLDIQRDHRNIIENTMGLLGEGGELIFSNNRKGFKIDASLSEQFAVKDISKQTIDLDFQRHTKIHQCWSIKK